MEISDFTNAGQTNSLSSALSQPGTGGDEFNSFLQLLTAQIRNQDPLAPLESTQFVEQLATFSTLEQQVQSNSSLEGIAQGINQLQSLIANQWLGETVSIETPTVPFDDKPLEFTFDKSEGVTRSVLTIYDSEDRAVWSETLDPSAELHNWSGQTNDGIDAKRGETYRFNVTQYQGDQFLSTDIPRFSTTILAVSPLGPNNTINLLTDLGINTGLESVRIRET